MSWLLLYALFLGILSYRSTINVSNSQDAFFVNSRKSSKHEVAFSIVASCVGGSATLGMAGLAWQVGTPAFWWLGTGALGLCVLACFLAKKVRESGAHTLPEMVTTYAGAPCRPLSSIIIILAWLAITSAQLSAMAALILPLLPDAMASLPTSIVEILNNFAPFTIALLLGSSIVIVYACIGGQAAIIKSDVLQYFLLMLALLLALFLLVGQAQEDNMQNILASVPLEFVNAEFPLSKFSYFLIILGGSYVVCPMLFGRLYSAKDSDSAKRGAVLAVFWLVLTAILIVCIGIVCRLFVENTAVDISAQNVLTSVLFDNLPPWAQVLCFLGIFSALISSADSSLLTAGTILSNDILRKKNVNVCRICTLVIGSCGIALALSGKGILQLLLMANDIYVCGVVAPVFVGMLLYKRRKLHANGMALAMAVGGCFGFVAAMSSENIYSYLGIISASIISILSIKRGIYKYSSQSADKVTG